MVHLPPLKLATEKDAGDTAILCSRSRLGEIVFDCGSTAELCSNRNEARIIVDSGIG